MGKNYFVITEKDHHIYPEGAYLNLYDYNPVHDTVTVSHYGSRNRFQLKAKMGMRTYNFPRKHLFLSFGYLFYMGGNGK